MSTIAASPTRSVPCTTGWNINNLQAGATSPRLAWKRSGRPNSHVDRLQVVTSSFELYSDHPVRVFKRKVNLVRLSFGGLVLKLQCQLLSWKNSQERPLLHDFLERLLSVYLDGRVVLLGGHLGLAHRREALVLLPGQLSAFLQDSLVVRLLLSRALKIIAKNFANAFWQLEIATCTPLPPSASCEREMRRSSTGRCGHL